MSYNPDLGCSYIQKKENEVSKITVELLVWPEYTRVYHFDQGFDDATGLTLIGSVTSVSGVESAVYGSDYLMVHLKPLATWQIEADILTKIKGVLGLAEQPEITHRDPVKFTDSLVYPKFTKS